MSTVPRTDTTDKKSASVIQRLLGFLGRERVMATVADSVAAMLMTTGFAHLFFTLSKLDIPLSRMLGIAFVCAVAIVFLTRKWWILPSLLLVAGGVAGLVLARAEEPRVLIQALVETGQHTWWVLTGYTASTPDILKPLAWMVVGLGSLVVFLLVRRLFNLLVYTAVTAAIFLSLWVVGQEPSITAMAYCAAGLAALFPRAFAASVNRRSGGKDRLDRGAMQVLGLPVCILCMLLALGLVPADTTSWKLRVLVNSVTDVKDLLDIWQGDTRPHDTFSIASMGFEPLGRLGGPIRPSAREVLRIRSDVGGLYLRGGTRDVYTGDQWQDSGDDERYRFGSLLWRGTQNEAFDIGRPAGSSRSAFLRDTTVEVNYTLTHMIDGMPFFFTGNRPEKVRIARSYGAIPFFNAQGEIYTYDTIPSHNGYAIRSRFFDAAAGQFDGAMLRWESDAEPDPAEWTSAIRERYLQLPADLPEEVSETAARVAGEGTPYERASRLHTFFHEEGFVYTLTPVVPPDMDFVAHFLETREGYCVYYATAMAVMARTQGLPARYVEGFVSPAPGAGNAFSITGKMAHAWTEIYFDGIGWVPFDPTPSRESETPTVTPSVTGPIEDPTITLEPTSYPVTPILPPPIDDSKGLGFGWILAGVLLLLASPAYWLTVRVRRQMLANRYRLSSVRRRFANRERQMVFYQRDILRQLACLDILPEPGETLTAFAQRADRRTGFRDVKIEEATDVVLRRRYGLQFPTGEDIAVQSQVHRALEKHLQATLTPGQYIRKRVFGLQHLSLPPGSDGT